MRVIFNKFNKLANEKFYIDFGLYKKEITDEVIEFDNSDCWDLDDLYISSSRSYEKVKPTFIDEEKDKFLEANPCIDCSKVKLYNNKKFIEKLNKLSSVEIRGGSLEQQQGMLKFLSNSRTEKLYLKEQSTLDWKNIDFTEAPNISWTVGEVAAALEYNTLSVASDFVHISNNEKIVNSNINVLEMVGQSSIYNSTTQYLMVDSVDTEATTIRNCEVSNAVIDTYNNGEVFIENSTFGSLGINGKDTYRIHISNSVIGSLKVIETSYLEIIPFLDYNTSPLDMNRVLVLEPNKSQKIKNFIALKGNIENDTKVSTVSIFLDDTAGYNDLDFYSREEIVNCFHNIEFNNKTKELTYTGEPLRGPDMNMQVIVYANYYRNSSLILRAEAYPFIRIKGTEQSTNQWFNDLQVVE